MNKVQQILNAIQSTEVKTVGCVFNEEQYAAGQARVYTYKTNLTNIALGDKVVVDAAKGMTVVTVVSEGMDIDGSTDIDYKWVVDKVSLASHDSNYCADVAAKLAIKADLLASQTAEVVKGVSEATVNAIRRL